MFLLKNLRIVGNYLVTTVRIIGNPKVDLDNEAAISKRGVQLLHLICPFLLIPLLVVDPLDAVRNLDPILIFYNPCPPHRPLEHPVSFRFMVPPPSTFPLLLPIGPTDPVSIWVMVVLTPLCPPLLLVPYPPSSRAVIPAPVLIRSPA